MKPVFIPILSLALLVAPAMGKDVAKPWSSVRFRVPHEESEAVVSLEGVALLAKVSLAIAGTVLEIPGEELAGLTDPRLASARLLFGEDWHGPFKEGEKPTPHFIIEMEYGPESEFGGYASVGFLFYGGKYQERIVLVRSSPNTWNEFRKFPGEEVVPTGTTTKLGTP